MEERVDFDIFLPTYNRPLQRDLVWTLDQKRELIWSVLIGRSIPKLSMIAICTEDYKNVWTIVDGKQRLTTLFDFVNDKFTIEVEGQEYLFSQLPNDYQRTISRFDLSFNVMYEPTPNAFSDDIKVEWFKFLNFAGTPQDKDHLNSFVKIES